MRSLFVPIITATLGLGLGMAAGSASAAGDKPDKFLEHAIQADNAEIKMGMLAQQKGEAKEIRDFGRVLTNDHREARTEAMGVAKEMGIRLSSNDAITPYAQREYEALQGLSGDQFDHEFVRHMLQDHRTDIDDFMDEAQGGYGRVSAMAKNQLPTLQKHLKTAESLRHDEDQDRKEDQDHRDKDNDKDRR